MLLKYFELKYEILIIFFSCKILLIQTVIKLNIYGKNQLFLFLILLGKLGNPSQKIALANIYPSKIIFNFNSDLNIYAIDEMI